LLKTCCKIYAKILNEEQKLHSKTFMAELQCGFCGGRSCIDAVFSLKLVLKKEENLI
jgi:hypothetical protein